MIKKHVRKSQTHPNGGIIECEGSIHISNVKLVEEPAKAAKSPKKSTKKAPKKAS